MDLSILFILEEVGSYAIADVCNMVYCTWVVRLVEEDEWVCI